MVRKIFPAVEYLDIPPDDYKPSDVSLTLDEPPNNLSLVDFDVPNLLSDEFWFFFESTNIDYLLYSDNTQNGLYIVSSFNPDSFKTAIRQGASLYEAISM